MAEGNGKDHKPVDTLFGTDSFDAGVIDGIGHIIIREARLADIWPYMGTSANSSEFGMRMLAASIEVNGRRLSFEEFGQIGMKHIRKLQALFPEVNRINGIGLDDDEEEDSPKNAEGAVVEAAPDGSATATGS